MKIIGFAGSTSKNSINKELVNYVRKQLPDVDFELLDLNDYEMPIYSIDRQNENGFPKEAEVFFNKIEEADGLVISLAEHNGNFATALKNILDWVSRIKMTYLEGKKVLLAATSPGGYGAKSVLEIGAGSFTFAQGDIVGKFSFPSFYDNFKDGEIVNKELKEALNAHIDAFVIALQSAQVAQ